MPMYEYKCHDCDEVFERLLSQSAPREGVTCPTCGSQRTKRMFSAFAWGKGSRGSGSTKTGDSCSLSFG